MLTPSIRFYTPDARLRHAFSAYYVVQFPDGMPPVRDQLHPEWSNLRFNLTGDWCITAGGQGIDYPASIFGPSSRTQMVCCTPPALGLGVGLLPLGWAHFVGVPANVFADRGGRLEDIYGAEATRLYDDLAGMTEDADWVARFDAFFLHLFETRPAPSPVLIKAHQALLDPAITTAEAFAEVLGVTERHAARLSNTLFGFPPKLLLRRQRFLRTMAALRENLDKPWADQLDGAYYDQSHFVRDFHRFMGSSPTAYFNSPRVLLAAAGQSRQRALGASLQGLHAASGPG